MAEEKTATEQVRKTVSMTHKQAGFTAGGIAALTAVLVGPLSQFFQTKLDAQKQGTSIAVQASQIAELKLALESSKVEIINTINSVAKPIAVQQDYHEKRIVNLEFIQMGGKSRPK
jgi:hypothetical protein